MAQSGGASAASRVFIAVAAAVLVLCLAIAGILLWEGQRAARAEAERVTRAVAETIADSTGVTDALARGDRAAATRALQPEIEAVIADADVDFVTIMDPAGIRITHRDPARIGEPYIGTIPRGTGTLTEEFTGTLGASVRTIVPVVSDGQVVGRVSVGVTIGSISEALGPRILAAVAIAVVLAATGLAGALFARRATRRVTGDLPAGAVRDAVSSYESMRTLGEALRAQTHEHGNRLHTAIALLELGRTSDAIDLLSEDARQSQLLVDQVTARREGDPTVGALLLGKASQAGERGVEWRARIDADAPRSVLSPVDAVSVIGNLIDNAVDAAASGPAPRWVDVRMTRTEEDELAVEVADSGTGIPAEIADRIFEHGFSTKPAGRGGRGVGLALVRAIVDEAEGTLALTAHPTTFRVILPRRDA
ncbi:sensor histidine kinase [Microbacterium oleivorans]|uniref:histidine kinase n=1 Tax=Microbacterium oleivorans TaxID=273677 RepID=A0A031FKD0_9MICO|nr:ATP-binding protein [Microbacterium oleivorans]AZS43356.1 Sensor protein CitS [Microbacterium oleivorans]EZP25314.1 putative signal transduction histidine kinase [Microbacterium oleivorans]THE06283.1 GHKL domain-containing protein [Microbacterium oleivorans]